MKKHALIPCFFLLASLALSHGSGRTAEMPSPALAYSLEDCVSLALKNNPNRKALLADAEGKKSTLAASRKDLYPALSLSYGYQRQFDPLVAVSKTMDGDTFNYGVNVEQPIYKGKSLITAVELNALGLDAANYTVTKSENDLVFQVYSTFYSVLKNLKLKEEAVKSLERLKSHVKDAKAFYDAGLIPKNDYLQSEVELAQGEQKTLQAESQLLLAQSSLNILVGRPVGDGGVGLIESKNMPIIEDKSSESHLIEALAQRTEVELAELAIVQAQKNITMVKAPYQPSVSVSATYQKQGNDLLARESDTGRTEAKTAQATARWNFWSWEQDQDKAAAANQALRAAQEKKAQVIDTISLEVREAYLNVVQTTKNIPVTEKAIVQAEENYRINEARYQSQLNTSTDVLDAEALLLAARTRYYSAIYDYRTALAQLDWVKGGINKKNTTAEKK